MPIRSACITGAAGFIGSHLAETLLDRGYTVIGIDNLLTGDTRQHLAPRQSRLLVHQHDVTNYIYVDGPVDYVLHWRAQPADDYLELPIPTLKVGPRHAQGARPGEGKGRDVRDRGHLGGVRRRSKHPQKEPTGAM